MRIKVFLKSPIENFTPEPRSRRPPLSEVEIPVEIENTDAIAPSTSTSSLKENIGSKRPMPFKRVERLYRIGSSSSSESSQNTSNRNASDHIQIADRPAIINRNKATTSKSIRKENEVKEYICRICDKPLVSKKNFNRHMNLHLKTIPYECNICGKVLYHFDSIKYHLKVHEERKHRCKICNKRFITATKLKRHLTVTKKCGKIFAQIKIRKDPKFVLK